MPKSEDKLWEWFSPQIMQVSGKDSFGLVVSPLYPLSHLDRPPYILIRVDSKYLNKTVSISVPYPKCKTGQPNRE